MKTKHIQLQARSVANIDKQVQQETNRPRALTRSHYQYSRAHERNPRSTTRMDNLNVEPQHIYHRLDFMVHNFTPHVSDPSSSSSQTAALIRAGRSLINKASSAQSNGWLDVKTGAFGESLIGTSKYTLTQPPPIYVSSQGDSRACVQKEVKEWGASIDVDDDIFSMGDLEEFESTDLSYLLLVDVKRLPAPVQLSNNRIHDRETYSTTEEAARKRRRLDISPLYNVISQPHIHPSTTNHTNHPPRISPYTKTKPIPIPPHTLPPPPRPPYSRTAWLVPIRGILPWDNCTSGLVLNLSDSHTPSSADKTNDQITWTHPSLVSFWSFLLAIRQAGTLGPIGISFHAARSPIPSAPSYSHSFSNISWIPSNFDSTVAVLGCQETVSKNMGTPVVVGARAESSTPVHICRVPLTSVDHFKVYHHAENAMYVRNVLDAWGFPAPLDGDGAMGKMRKIRLLKGAKLVLVDEKSNGVLIS